MGAKGGISKTGEQLVKLALLLIGGFAVIALFSDGESEPEQHEGLVQIMPYTLYDHFDSVEDESRKWRVEFILPVELQSGGQVICEALVDGQQYSALAKIEPHSQNGTMRYAPVWIRRDSVSNSHYRCDLNVNGTNIPWQVPRPELDEINFRNRNKMPL